MGDCRAEFTAVEIDEVRHRLVGRLASVGLPSDPEMVRKVLELVGDDSAGMADFADLLRADAPLTGRLLKVANSSYFAQRRPVTTVDRACVVLGMSRIRSIALGVYLGTAAAQAGDRKLTRRVWGRSLYRACIAGNLMHDVAPALSGEAFVVGLMLDAGLPIMPTLVGDSYADVLATDPPPAVLVEAEARRLPFTHEDVLAALCMMWKLPDHLSKAMRQRYVKPTGFDRNLTDPSGLLRRAAQVAGVVHFGGAETKIANPDFVSTQVERVIGFSPAKVADLFENAAIEYAATAEIFSGFADPVENIEELAAGAHNALLAVVERAITDGADPERFTFDGWTVELRRDAVGAAVAVLIGSEGEPVATHPYVPGEADAEKLLDALGIDAFNDVGELHRFAGALTRSAA